MLGFWKKKEKTAEEEVNRIENDILTIVEYLDTADRIAEKLEDLEIDEIWDNTGEDKKIIASYNYRLKKMACAREKIVKRLLENDSDYFDVYLGDLLDAIEQELIATGILSKYTADKTMIMRKVGVEPIQDKSGKFTGVYRNSFEYGFEFEDANGESRSYIVPVTCDEVGNQDLTAEDVYYSANKSFINLLDTGILTDNRGGFTSSNWQPLFMGMVENNILDMYPNKKFKSNGRQFEMGGHDLID